MTGAKNLLIAIIATAAVTPVGAWAQDTVRVGARASEPEHPLPRAAASQIVDFYNRPETIHFSGRTRVPQGRMIEGDVAILGGPVELAGTVDGDLLVLNGDIELHASGRVTGDLTVVGGVASGVDRGRVDGVVTTYSAVFRYRRTPDGIEYLGSEPEREPPWDRKLGLPSWTLGESEIHVSARAYNRIEGLPIALGPRVMTGGRNPLLLEALLVYRTEAGFDPDDKDLGYEVTARQWLGGHRDLWLEAGLVSLVQPIERWKLTNLENSLALFLFRRDYRDYYERQGWYGRLGWAYRAFSGALEFIDESQRTLDARTPWTILFNTDADHRPNAAVVGGDLQSVALNLAIDTRNDRDHPWQGWYHQARLEQAVGGDLGDGDPEFTHFFLDLRRYNRVSRGSVLALRWVSGGRIGNESLPAQRQHALGGAGSLPGYDQLEFDCGQRDAIEFGTVPGYGCQRFALFQAEYRTGLDFDFRWDHSQVSRDVYGDVFSVEFEPTVVLFYDAGAAWSSGEGFIDHLTVSNNWVADVGGGLDFGGIGIYTAYPLVGSGGFNFLVRLTGRF